MFEFLTKSAVPQTGLIFEPPKVTDKVFGEESSIGASDVLEDGNWRLWVPSGERQNVEFVFDTKSCASFAAHNTLESYFSRIHFLGRIPEETIEFLKENGYFDEENKINFSDKFTAILSGTTINGNSYNNVFQSIRSNGLVPQSALGFNNETTFFQWHNQNQITQKLLSLGKAFLEHFEVEYEWVFANDNSRISDDEVDTIQSSLKQSPLAIAVPIPSYHAIMLTQMIDGLDWWNFDSYAPYERNAKKWKDNINFGVRVILTPKKAIVFIFTKTLRKGSYGFEVKKLQERLRDRGFFVGVVDGKFGPVTHNAVVNFQSTNHLEPDGIVGRKTRAVLNGKTTEELQVVGFNDKIVKWARAIQQKEGYFAPGENPKYPNGTLAWKNNNPGNIKHFGQKGIEKRGIWCYFPSYKAGFEYLCSRLTSWATPPPKGRYSPEMTLLQWAGVYAPKVENDTLKYAKDISTFTGVDINEKIRHFLT